MSQSSALAAPVAGLVAGPERRQAERHACQISTAYHTLADAPLLPRLAWIADISRLGLALVAGHAIRPATRLGVEVRSPDGTFSYLLIVRVVRTVPYRDGWLAGCAFDRPLTDEELENLL
jgi:hypothetical protein